MDANNPTPQQQDQATMNNIKRLVIALIALSALLIVTVSIVGS
ncbi:hypothetical protein [Dasania marina]|tara:strand:- start:28705 stop:28833 length:129 start_codon:yes stop_codon:yes gene_type:complete